MALTRASLGVGAPIPKENQESSLQQKHLSNDGQLRKQLLGKQASNHEKDVAMRSKLTPGKAVPDGTPTELKRSRDEPDSDEEGGGRASAFKAKKLKLSESVDASQAAASKKGSSILSAHATGCEKDSNAGDLEEQKNTKGYKTTKEDSTVPPSTVPVADSAAVVSSPKEAKKKRKRERKKKKRKNKQQLSEVAS